jgi:hypothetical protein
MAVLVTVARERWPDLFEGLIDQLADCFPRRETRMTCRNMIEAMLTVEETANCWTLGEAIGHRGPHVLQHFLSGPAGTMTSSATESPPGQWTSLAI